MYEGEEHPAVQLDVVSSIDSSIVVSLHFPCGKRVGGVGLGAVCGSVFTVTIESEEVDVTGLRRMRTARFSLVDLAGSERQKNTGAAGARLREVRFELAVDASALQDRATTQLIHLLPFDGCLCRIGLCWLVRFCRAIQCGVLRHHCV